MPRPKPRRRMHWAAYLWPGLPHLWINGSLAGLSLALAFSVLMNVLILAVLVWPEWLELRLKVACGIGATLLWLAALWETRGELRRLAAREALQEHGSETEKAEETPEETLHPNDQRLRDAQRSYLQGDWVTAEQTLRKAVRTDRRDVEASLWYATLLCRTGRLRPAARRLKRLARLDNAVPWRYELEQELHWIEEKLKKESLPTVPVESPPAETRSETIEKPTLEQPNTVIRRAA